MSSSVPSRLAVALILLGLSSVRLAAQCNFCAGTPLPVGQCSTTDRFEEGAGCSAINNCQTPTVGVPSLVVLPQPNGTSTVRLTVDVVARWNGWAADPAGGNNLNSTLDITWFNVSPAPTPWTSGGSPSLCEYQSSDRVETYIQQTGLTCANAPYFFGSYSLRASVCGGPCPPPFFPGCGSFCGKWADANSLDFTVTPEALGCNAPRKDRCGEGGTSCSLCRGADACGGASVGGKGASCDPRWAGPGASLRYTAGGAGGTGFPGTAAWQTTLGRYWSHDYAQRIVADPDETHVWLITPGATFREWSSLNAGTGVYAVRSPSDEYRTLKWLGAGLGWELEDLDGTVHTFAASGLWTGTTDRNGSAKIPAYTGATLTSVSFPDGRSEVFTYHLSGKLAAIAEVGVDGTTTRTWGYTWSGDDLALIERPDGTAWEFFYSDPLHPGYLTRMNLVGTDTSRRIEAAWEYDAHGNVVKTWKGDPLFTGPNAVEKHVFTFTNPTLPTETVVTDPLGSNTTYFLARDTRSSKPKLTRVSGTCTSCGVGPETQFFYTDPANPLLPTRVRDGRNTETQYAYNANGRMTSKREAANRALARETTWQYGNASYPGFPTQIDVPSILGGANKRRTVLQYNAAGDLTTRTESGSEAGAAFSYATTTAYNAAGQPLTIDPPGFTTAPTDVTTFTYNVTGTNGHLPDTRTDPLIGATTFGYDPFNRRTSTTDPNGQVTETVYDSLNRVTSVTQKGAVLADDLVTVHSYNARGDLESTTLPRGNVIEYTYDTAGRLVSIERKPDAVTPGERTFYTLDGAGNRTKEELQSWNGSAWVTESFTDYVYTSSCRLEKAIHADGSVTEYAYDCNGNLEKIWDANHPSASNPTPTQRYAYDDLNRLTSITQPWAGAAGGTAITAYTYDVQDHLKTVTDANGNVTTYTWSDRDLLTRRVSPVSGTTDSTYNPHGELKSEKDARNITVLRTTDPLDRVTLLDYTDNTLDVAFTYDDPGVPFSKGRLTAITRNGAPVNYAYDRFGRTTQDGALTYTYDKNGNRATTGYPGGVTATWTHDFADRQSTLAVQDGANPPQPLATATSYKPFGPLASLTLGNGLTETRSHDTRYLPSGITVPGLLDWAYANDDVGNILSITDNLNPANNRTYSYLDHVYYLTQGNGPWGALAWTYDKIGNRLTENAEAYTYVVTSTKTTPKLLRRVLGATTINYTHDTIGDITRIGTTNLVYDQARRLKQAGTNRTFLYDGRSYLRQATETITGGANVTTPTYDSDGLLHHRLVSRPTTSYQSDAYTFYFAGRPVATLDKVIQGGTPTTTLLYLTTDHLGTPVLATDPLGVGVWAGGFTPFGGDWNGAAGAGVFLRFPGQWVDGTWGGFGDFGLYYNVHRWYESKTGRYNRPDPYPPLGIGNLYQYAISNPALYIDSDGKAPQLMNPSLPGIGISSRMVGCLVKSSFLTGVGWIWQSGGPRYAHCIANCELAKCGGQNLAIVMGGAKEAFDLKVCNTLPRGMGYVGHVKDKHCRSAFQSSDFKDNDWGRACPSKVPCENWCGELFGQQDTVPGPYYGR